MNIPLSILARSTPIASALPVPPPAWIETLERRDLMAVVPIGPEIQVAGEYNNQFSFPYTPASVAMDANGNFIVAWANTDPEPNPWNPNLPMVITNIHAQRYYANGFPQGEEFIVNTFGDQYHPHTRPSVAMDAEGDFVITWNYTADVTVHRVRENPGRIGKMPDWS